MLKYISFLIILISVLPNRVGAQQNQSSDIPQERIYLHTNGSVFLSGESLLFKVYCQSLPDNNLSDLSKIALIELRDSDQKTILKTKIALRNGEGAGDFFLPSSLASANYTLVAYTQWMRNQGPTAYFAEKILLINPFNKAPSTAGKENPSVEVQDQRSEIISLLVSSASIVLERRPADASGSDDFYIQVSNDTGLYLEKDIRLNPGEKTFEFELPNLKPGLYQVSLRDPSKKTLIQKQYFYNSDKGLSPNIVLKSDKDLFGHREKVSLAVESFDILSSLSVSIRKYEEERQFKPELTKGLRALFPFQKNLYDLDQSKIQEKLRGNFQTDLFPSGHEIKFLPDFRGDLISGKLPNPPQKPEESIVYLTIPGQEYFFYAGKADSLGRFYFNADLVEKGQELIITQSPGLSNDSPPILASEFDEEKLELDLAGPRIDSSWTDWIRERSVQVQIENAYYRNKKDERRSRPRSNHYFGQEDKLFLLDDYTRFPDMIDVIRENISALFIRKRNDKFNLTMMDRQRNTPFTRKTMVLLDGLPILDFDQILAYDPLLVEKVKLYQKRYFLGPLDCAGLVSFETYTGDLKNFPFASNQIKFPFTPVQSDKNYFHPNYADANKNTERIPDYRYQLYWNPFLRLDEKGKAAFTFYTGDNPGKYQVVVEGFAKDGSMRRGTYVFEVKEKK